MKPRLVFFRWHDPDLPDFVRLHLAEQVNCLSQFFEVTVLGDASLEYDYAAVCDQYEPDLVVFESGVYNGKRRITNTAANPDVPKLGFFHSDAYCPSRISAISDMARWGVEDFFAISVSMGEYTPEIADRLFVWPNFVDPHTYRDYQQPKLIPLLLTGSLATHYPWRNRVSRATASAFPTMTTPHAGWFQRKTASRMLFGEDYARLINAAKAVPTCGTIAKDVVRKHFEIPAAGACLLTERTASIEAAGFVDMVNCVFVDDDDVVSKLDQLFADPDQLAAITAAGRELVARRHTAAQRDELLQWLTLRRQLKPGEKIAQPAPFQPLAIVSDRAPATAVISGGTDRLLMRDGDLALAEGRIGAAEELYLRCLNFHPMPEPSLRLARCHLFQGRAKAAIDRLNRTTETSRLAQGSDPDPVEWAYLLRALACDGQVREARLRARELPDLHHPELARMRAALLVLAGSSTELAPADPAPNRRRSLHVLPPLDLDAWVDEFAAQLLANGQDAYARALLAARGRTSPSAPTAGLVDPPRALDAVIFRSRQLRRKVERRAQREFARFVKPPTIDPLSRLVKDLAEKENIQTAGVLGGPASYQDVLAGALNRNPNRPTLVASPLEPVDLMFIESRNLAESDVDRAGRLAAQAQIVLVHDLSTPQGERLSRDLIDNDAFILAEHDPTASHGLSLHRRP